MANQKTCYYCGNTFPYTGNFGVKTSKFSQVYPVCSKKCEIEFNANKLPETVENEKQGGCISYIIYCILVIGGILALGFIFG
jgi:ribosomal protein L24E